MIPEFVAGVGVRSCWNHFPSPLLTLRANEEFSLQ